MLPFLHELEEFANSLKSKTGIRLQHKPILILGAALLVVSFLFMPGVVARAFAITLFLAPLWLPMLLVGGAWHLWIRLRRSEFIASQKYLLLEIKPPRSIVKTPLAMETVLSGIHLSPGESNWYQRSILGRTRPFWSLEIASFEGQVHFFIWTRAGFRRLIEAQIYSQYPGAQVVEVPDYTRMVSATPQEWSIWGCDYEHTVKDSDPLPIKTYIEYGLDKTQKEPEQIDPLANLIEFLGQLGKGENIWIQYVIRVHKGEKYNKVNASGSTYTWKDRAKEMIDEIRKSTRDPYIDPATGKEVPGFPNPTKGQSEKIAAIERNVSKLPFDVGIRAIYLTKPEKFDPININGLNGLFKQFSSEGWNGLKWTGWMTDFNDYPWETGVNHLKDEYRTALVEAYRRRQFFYPPFDFEPHVVMSTEELATIYHIPSRAVETPGLPRLQSQTGEAPVNLPT